jgi:hypothetical protein
MTTLAGLGGLGRLKEESKPRGYSFTTEDIQLIDSCTVRVDRDFTSVLVDDVVIHRGLVCAPDELVPKLQLQSGVGHRLTLSLPRFLHGLTRNDVLREQMTILVMMTTYHMGFALDDSLVSTQSPTWLHCAVMPAKIDYDAEGYSPFTEVTTYAGEEPIPWSR